MKSNNKIWCIFGFAFVSFNPCRKAAQRPKIWMTVTFGLGYRKESSRIDVATEPYPNRWTHHVMVGCVEGILGLRPTPDGLVIRPAIPAEWDGFTMDKTFRGKRLHITVDNAAHKEGNPTKVLVNGVEVEGVLTDAVLTDECQITVVM